MISSPGKKRSNAATSSKRQTLATDEIFAFFPWLLIKNVDAFDVVRNFGKISVEKEFFVEMLAFNNILSWDGTFLLMRPHLECSPLHHFLPLAKHSLEICYFNWQKLRFICVRTFSFSNLIVCKFARNVVAKTR